MYMEEKPAKRKYPMKWFWHFVLMNFLFHYFYLLVPGVILCVVGVWVKTCLWIGLAILLLDLIFSVIDQLRIVKAATAESDNPEFNELMDAFCGDGGLQAVGDLLNQRIAESTPVDPEEEEN